MKSDTPHVTQQNARSYASSSPPSGISSLKANRFATLFNKPNLLQDELKNLLWNGVPEDDSPHTRVQAWQLMLGYLPLNKDRRTQAISQKRQEYFELIKEHYDTDRSLSAEEQKLLRQIRIDLVRTRQDTVLFTCNKTQMLMERILFVWAVRNPASGYVQGINELLLPFINVFLRPYADVKSWDELDGIKIDTIDSEAVDNVEADSYWCLSKLVARIQDHYTFSQPGIQRLLNRLSDLVKRIDVNLYNHITSKGLTFLQFAFRWMNCLLLRELPMHCVIRLWDTYIAEGTDGFSTFHVYVCAVFLGHWSPTLKSMDFQQMLLFLQKLPTANWTLQNIEEILAEAYVLQSLFHESPMHLSS